MRKEKVLQWQPAPCGKLKLNLEGPIIHGTNFVGIGVLLRNEAGEVLFAISRKEVGVFYVDDIKAFTALRGLHMLRNIGCHGLILEGGSLHIIDAIKSQEPNFTAQAPIISEIQQLLHHFPDWELCHVGRQGNEAAHMLTRHACKVDDKVQWWNTCPDVIFNRVLMEVKQ